MLFKYYLKQLGYTRVLFKVVHHFSLLAGQVPDDVPAIQPDVPEWVKACPVIPFKKDPLDPLTIEEAMALFSV